MSASPPKLLITGARGYLGSAVTTVLAGTGVPFFGTGRHGGVGLMAGDLLNAAETASLLAVVQPTCIIHCAAEVPRAPRDYANGGMAWRSVLMLRTLAAEARCPIIFTSSLVVCRPEVVALNTAAGNPLVETDAGPPLTGYADGKWQAEQLLIGREHPGDVILRLPGLFGLPKTRGLLYQAIHACLTTGRFQPDLRPGLWLPMAVEDAAAYCVRVALAASDVPCQAINVAYDEPISVGSALAQVAARCGGEIPPIDDRPSLISLARLQASYGLLPLTFGTALDRLIAQVRQSLGVAAHV